MVDTGLLLLCAVSLIGGIYLILRPYYKGVVVKIVSDMPTNNNIRCLLGFHLDGPILTVDFHDDEYSYTVDSYLCDRCNRCYDQKIHREKIV
jgi:hypothetical protein